MRPCKLGKIAHKLWKLGEVARCKTYSENKNGLIQLFSFRVKSGLHSVLKHALLMIFMFLLNVIMKNFSVGNFKSTIVENKTHKHTHTHILALGMGSFFGPKLVQKVVLAHTLEFFAVNRILISGSL